MKTKQKPVMTFILEWVFVLFCFLVCAYISILLFSKSIYQNKQANKIKEALIYAQNYVEEGNIKEGTYVVDDYELVVTKEQDSFTYYKIQVKTNDDILCEVTSYEE